MAILELQHLINLIKGKKFPKNKALAYDCLPTSILKLNVKDFPEQQEEFKEIRLKHLITHFLNWKKNYPHPAQISRLIVFNKDPFQKPNISNLRPISAISPIRRALETPLKNALELITKKTLDKSQTGFVSKLGTEVNLLRITLTWKDISNKKKKQKFRRLSLHRFEECVR